MHEAMQPPLMSLVPALAESNAATYDHIFKIILIGDNGVGKSSFIRRYSHSLHFLALPCDMVLSADSVNRHFLGRRKPPLVSTFTSAR